MWPILALVVVIMLPGRPAGGEIVSINGVDFADRFAVDEIVLELRGVAMLRWARLIDLYAGAFYLPRNVASKDWGEDVAKHLELRYFRDISAEDFVESSQKQLERTLSPDMLEKLQPRLDRFYKLFRDVSPGDRYGLTYVPSSGTTLSLNGEPLGRIPGSDFATAYFGIWLGTRPLQEKFRDRIMGISAS